MHARDIAALAIHGVHQQHIVVHQLRQIFVAARDHGFQTLLAPQHGQRAQHIIGFHIGYDQYRPAQQLYHLVDGRNLRAQIIGHGVAVGFVLGVECIAESAATGIKHHGAVLRRHFVLQRRQHIHHAADGTRGRAVAVLRVGAQIRHGMKGAVEVAGTVDEQESFVIWHGQDCRL